MGRSRAYKIPRYRGNVFFGRRLNLLDWNNRSSRRENVKQEGIVVGFQVDVASAEMKERLEKAVLVIDRRIEDLALRAEKGSLTAEDFDDRSNRSSFDDDDFADLPPKKLKAAVRRRLDSLNDAKMQVSFLAEHVIAGVTYRLDAEDARRLATLHVEVE